MTDRLIDWSLDHADLVRVAFISWSVGLFFLVAQFSWPLALVVFASNIVGVCVGLNEAFHAMEEEDA